MVARYYKKIKYPSTSMIEMLEASVRTA